MFLTIILTVVGAILLLICFVKFVIGNRISVEQLNNFSANIEDYCKDNTPRFTTDKQKNIYLDDGLKKATNLHVIALSPTGKSISLMWANGSRSYFIPRSEEGVAAMKRFGLALLGALKKDKTIKEAELKKELDAFRGDSEGKDVPFIVEKNAEGHIVIKPKNPDTAPLDIKFKQITKEQAEILQAADKSGEE